MLSLQEAWAKWKELSDERPRIGAFTERPESRKCALDLYVTLHHGSLPAAFREERGSQVASRALSDTRIPTGWFVGLGDLNRACAFRQTR
jgi:hypothetical protein